MLPADEAVAAWLERREQRRLVGAAAARAAMDPAGARRRLLIAEACNALLVLVLVLAPYKLLVQLAMVLLTPVFLVVLLTYARMERRTAGPRAGAAATVVWPLVVTAGPLACTVLNFYVAAVDDAVVLGIPKVQMLGLALMLLGGARYWPSRLGAQ